MSQGLLDDDEAGALETPAVVVDLDRMDARIASMARLMRERGIALRPHAKTHKSVEVARRQIEAGAVGLTVATIGEAEVFADAGFTDLFIAYPVLASGPEGRAAARAGVVAATLSVGADSAVGLEALAAAMRGASGRSASSSRSTRAGRGPASGPTRLDRSLAGPRTCGLEVAGAFTHEGHGYKGTDLRRGGRRGRGGGPGGRRGVAPRRRHRTDGAERGLDADRSPVRARGRDRGTARHVRLRRPTAGRARGRAPGGRGPDGRGDGRQRGSRWRLRHRRRGQDPGPGRLAVHRRATARSSATPRPSSSGSTITTASSTCRRARHGRRSGRSSGSCRITSVRWSTSSIRSSWPRADALVDRWPVDARGRNG